MANRANVRVLFNRSKPFVDYFLVVREQVIAQVRKNLLAHGLS
jgi:hypothetical protein